MKAASTIFLLFLFVITAYAQEMTFKQLRNILNEKAKNVDVDLSKLGFSFHKSIKQPYGTVSYYNYKDSTSDKKHYGFDVTIKDGKIISVGYDTQSEEEFNHLIQGMTSDSTYKSKKPYLGSNDQPEEGTDDEYSNGVYTVDYSKWKRSYGIDYSVSISLYVAEPKLITTPVENIKQQ